MQIIETHPLKSLHTFGIDVKARHFIEFKSTNSIIDFVKHELKHFNMTIILNCGSNVLFTKDFDVLALKISTSGM